MPAETDDTRPVIFISYAREDGSEAAARLDEALRERGYKTWRDVRNINRAADFTAEIEDAIESSRFVVVCVTSGVKRKDSFVRREITYASLLKKPILVARFEDIPPPITIVNNTSFDFFKNRDKTFSDLCYWLEENPSDIPPPAALPPKPPKPPPPVVPGPDEPNKDDSGGTPPPDDQYKEY
ncbi:MAG: toll/interleukin-1 receptor domain-containing protein, partial [Anaerolineae bacterium]|nr:toll/interleukin-1 receptor domain-containing protein [Anaerolineae bacterium]